MFKITVKKAVCIKDYMSLTGPKYYVPEGIKDNIKGSLAQVRTVVISPKPV
jgi:hypothetical protein